MAGRCCHGREALGTYGTPSHNSASYSEAPQPTQADLPPPSDTRSLPMQAFLQRGAIADACELTTTSLEPLAASAHSLALLVCFRPPSAPR